MPAFGLAQSGPNPIAGLNITSLFPGDSIALFDGTETVALNLASIPFARAERGPTDGGSTFNLSGMPAGMTVDVQVCSSPAGGFASVAAMNAAFNSVVTMTPDANGNGSYTDVGRSQFYRFLISGYSSGTMPVGVVQR
jgi:hypothetical protein